METRSQVVVARPAQDDDATINFLRSWNDSVLRGEEGAKEYSAQVDTGHNFYTLAGVWPWSFRAGLVAFRYSHIENEPTVP